MPQNSPAFKAEIEIVVANGKEGIFAGMMGQDPESFEPPPYPLTNIMSEDGYHIEAMGERTFLIKSDVGLNIDYLTALYGLTKTLDRESILESALVTRIKDREYRIGYAHGEKIDSGLVPEI